jgi:glutamate dehydrogenase
MLWGRHTVGLDHGELMRLVEAALPIAAFDPAKLSRNGSVHSTATRDGVKRRNSMHNRVVADAFLPAGGRPGTINESNWEHFLRADGRPSSLIIAEGANLFVTPEARQHLSQVCV